MQQTPDPPTEGGTANLPAAAAAAAAAASPSSVVLPSL